MKIKPFFRTVPSVGYDTFKLYHDIDIDTI